MADLSMFVPSTKDVEDALDDALRGDVVLDTVPSSAFTRLLYKVRDQHEITDEDRQQALRLRQDYADRLVFGPEPAADSEES